MIRDYLMLAVFLLVMTVPLYVMACLPAAKEKEKLFLYVQNGTESLDICAFRLQRDEDLNACFIMRYEGGRYVPGMGVSCDVVRKCKQLGY